ncbi:MAG TPA: LysR family transcriptional regulator [Arachnia sp.]|nr:LysR family transcriptional regulator [Arachnia sp.]HMT87129.1 LysR family transcriptional regulator [Arachnia sp.]
MAERLNIEGLRYARAVSETGSFSAAARAYGVTQPALSNGIARLEEHLGARLFDRSPRGVSPTPFGVHMLPLIEQALRGLDTVTAESLRWTTPPTGTIRMGVSPLINPRLVARAYSAVCGLDSTVASRELVLREANCRRHVKTDPWASDET